MHIPRRSDLLLNECMATSKELRIENLRTLIKEFKTADAVAQLAATAPMYLSQILNGVASSAGKPRGVGDALARKLEAGCSKPVGWMDQPHTEQLASKDEQRAQQSNVEKNKSEVIEIPQYTDIGGGMGGGVTLRDQPGAIQGWHVTPEWVSKNIKSHSGAGNLCIVTGFGNSMQPLYNPGDPLIIDRGIKSVEADATYFFRVGEEGFIKILQRIPGEGIRVISKNKDYETWTIKPGMDFEVFGQVLKAWCGTDV